MQPQKITFILKSFNYPGLITDSRGFQIILKRPILPFFWPEPAVLAGSCLGRWQAEKDNATIISVVFYLWVKLERTQNRLWCPYSNTERVSRKISTRFTSKWVSQGANNSWAEWEGAEAGTGLVISLKPSPLSPRECWERVSSILWIIEQSMHSGSQNHIGVLTLLATLWQLPQHPEHGGVRSLLQVSRN